MNLYLVRHPRPLGTRGRCYGRQDVNISARSLRESLTALRAHDEAHALRTGKIFSSPSLRCVRLARALAAPREPLLAAELMEMDFGTWEGVAWDAVPRAELDAWAGDVWNYRPGGAESAALLAERWTRWLARLTSSGIETAVAVTHAGVIRVARLCCGTLSAANFAQTVIGYGSVHRIDGTRRIDGAAIGSHG